MMVILNRNKKKEVEVDSTVMESAIFLVKAMARIEAFEKDSNILASIVEENNLQEWLESADSVNQLTELATRIEDAEYKRNTFYKHLQNLIKHAGVVNKGGK